MRAVLVGLTEPREELQADPRLPRTWQNQSPGARSQLTPVNGYPLGCRSDANAPSLVR